MSHGIRRHGAIGSVVDDMSVLRPARALLAEDNRDMRQLLAQALRSDGFEVMEAADGNELLDRLASGLLKTGHTELPDLVVSDVRMPGASGLAVLAGLRRADWATPVILITGFGDEATHAEAARLGAAAVFDKPFDINNLRTAAVYYGQPRTRQRRE